MGNNHSFSAFCSLQNNRVGLLFVIMTRKEHNNSMVKRHRRPAHSHTSSKWDTLVHYDKQLTSRCSVCASWESSWGSFRPLVKLLEISGHGVPWFAIPLYILYKSHGARDSDVFNPTANLILGLLLDLLINFIVKGMVQRPRPVQNKDDMIMTISVDSFSFPSGHCTRAAFILYFFFTTSSLSMFQEVMIFAWTVAVCMSRIWLGRHYWSDVICGFIIGIIQGVVIERNWKTWDLAEIL